MRILLSFFALALLFVSSQSHAQIEACGVPQEPTMETEAQTYCDIHQRRLAYRESQQDFKSLLDQRRENYQAPNQEIRSNYQRDLDALNQTR